MSPHHDQNRYPADPGQMTRIERRRSRSRLRRAGKSLRGSRLVRGAGVAALAAVVIGSTTTLSRFADMAIIRADVSSGIELAALSGDETIVAVSARPGTELAQLSTDELVPGATVEVPLRLANNSPGSAIAPTITVTAEPGDDTGVELLRHFTAEILQGQGDERRDITEPPQEPEEDASRLEVRAAPDRLEPREGAPQQAGEAYTGGPDAADTYTILLTLEDVPELRAISGASWNVSISLEGMSHL
ncbi:MAG TPA: hypothetical protein H9871_07185 [Candidatus Nesterenkonia stercoripullorum]|uniref:Uncharacterized protein n=1 Tax=Candidatus Nesterenkonia stercoripullorum TaxID=2838701 RepID=A0A9D1UT31_9MICC|nr:hypothetical protein [Candidatus Nesterenkonia stercoripullorum]